jgi:hypothetical protein
MQMSHRVLASTLSAAVAAVLLAAPAFAQTPAAAVKTKPAAASAIPRTADGHPDLSGVYSNATTVPLARPANLGAKEFYTDEADREASRAGGGRGGAAGGGGRGGRGGGANIDPETGQPALQVHYDTSQFGLSGNTIIRSASLRTSIITGPEGKLPPLTPEAQKRQADNRAYTQAHQWDGPESRPLAERCIMWGNEGPPMMPAGYNSDLQIVQGEGYVSVVQEMIHDPRIIPTDGRPHLPENVKQWFGDARGHWEGDKLVVETTNFTNKTSVQNTPTTDKLKVTEKFSRVDANTVLYEFTVDDPGTWTKPWSGEIAMTKLDTPVYEYACHEGNYGMANNLSGARATEKK